MKNKTQKQIKVCSVLAFVLCTLWFILKVFYFVGLLTGKGGVADKVNWSDNGVIKVVFFAIYFFSSFSMIGLCFLFVSNVLKGLRELVAFPKNNVKPLLWLALDSFVYLLCWTNQPLLFRKSFAVSFAGADFIIPFLLLFFAFMYKIAADAVEENNLTI